MSSWHCGKALALLKLRECHRGAVDWRVSSWHCRNVLALSPVGGRASSWHCRKVLALLEPRSVIVALCGGVGTPGSGECHRGTIEKRLHCLLSQRGVIVALLAEECHHSTVGKHWHCPLSQRVPS